MSRLVEMSFAAWLEKRLSLEFLFGLELELWYALKSL